MARNNSERRMGLQIARQVGTIERLKADNERLERELAFARAHLVFHHPADGKTCGWERDFMIRLDAMIAHERESNGQSEVG